MPDARLQPTAAPDPLAWLNGPGVVWGFVEGHSIPPPDAATRALVVKMLGLGFRRRSICRVTHVPRCRVDRIAREIESKPHERHPVARLAGSQPEAQHHDER